MITHDERMLDVCDRILTLRDGQLIGKPYMYVRFSFLMDLFRE